MGGKYFAAYKCQLCGKVVMYGEPAELPDDNAAHQLVQQFIGIQKNQSNPFVKKPPMYVPHRCKDGSAGIAMFSGFAKVKE